MIWLALVAGLVLVAAGYGLGRTRPLNAISDWANWQKHDPALSRRHARWWAVWIVLSAENIGWLLIHPRKGWHAWRHRNDPPPPRSPAIKIRPRDPEQEA